MFELYLDTADLGAIREIGGRVSLAGVTTNPKIIAASGLSFEAAMSGICELLEPEQKLFAQVIATDVDGIIADARAIAALRPANAIPKIPVTSAGLAAIKRLAGEGMEVLATAIYDADTAFAAALNGAAYLAPYVNRMCNLGDGIAEVCELIEMLAIQGMDAKVLAASFKNANQVHQLILNGCPAATLPPDVCRAFAYNPYSEAATEEFGQAWEQAFGRTTLR